ncbi:MAG TPA: hypothetical protein VI278_08670 [Nitrososphaeraceae archaeon]|jgi:hypothetical protein
MLAAVVPSVNGKWEVKEVPSPQSENVRWSMNSKQGARYIKRRMGNDLRQKILVQNGII